VVDIVSSAPEAPPPHAEHATSFHFRRGQAVLVEADQRELGEVVKRIRSVMQQGRISRAQIECWASTEGERNLNWRLSQQRCAWFRHQVWDRLLSGERKPDLQAAAHGPDNPPFGEPESGDSAVLEEVRGKNRVVVLEMFGE
jgi:outer membrane protein OmpA-like peptidoglycan-associated protein